MLIIRTEEETKRKGSYSYRTLVFEVPDYCAKMDDPLGVLSKPTKAAAEVTTAADAADLYKYYDVSSNAPSSTTTIKTSTTTTTTPSKPASSSVTKNTTSVVNPLQQSKDDDDADDDDSFVSRKFKKKSLFDEEDDSEDTVRQENLKGIDGIYIPVGAIERRKQDQLVAADVEEDLYDVDDGNLESLQAGLTTVTLNGGSNHSHPADALKTISSISSASAADDVDDLFSFSKPSGTASSNPTLSSLSTNEFDFNSYIQKNTQESSGGLFD